jgi:acyl-CoA hydrolase
MMCVVLSADMSCQGQVVYTGRSSLDICMELLQVLDQTLY